MFIKFEKHVFRTKLFQLLSESNVHVFIYF